MPPPCAAKIDAIKFFAIECQPGDRQRFALTASDLDPIVGTAGMIADIADF